MAGPYLAFLNMRAFYQQGASVPLIDPLDVADEDLVAVISNMGAPLVGKERLTHPRTIARAVTMMRSTWAGHGRDRRGMRAHAPANDAAGGVGGTRAR